MMGIDDKPLAPRGGELSKLLHERITRALQSYVPSRSCCVGLVDIVNSTVNTASISNGKVGQYYCIFLHTMSAIVEEFGARVVKNLGDSILYYFPRTDYDYCKDSLSDVIECSLTILESRDTVNELLSERSLPKIDLRVSADYGTIARSHTPAGEDIFGSTVNLCSKINGGAKSNMFVIGGDLYEIVKSFKRYSYYMLGSYALGFKFGYPVYSVSRREPHI